jgi:signal transduction histidine kinase
MYPINWLHFVYGLAGGSLLSLAAINAVLATRGSGLPARGHRLFALIALAAAGIGVFELLLANSRTIDGYASLIRAAHIPVSVLVLSIPWFVRALFRVGRPWLAVLGNLVWGVALLINFLEPQSRLYDPITRLDRVSWFGATEFTVVQGVTHPGAWIGYAGVFLTLLFVADATSALWKRDGFRRSAIVASCLFVSLALALLQSALVDLGMLRSPYFISVAFVFIVGGMALELVHSSIQLPILEHEVEVRDAEVVHLSRQHMLTEMSGGVAHELSQPLNAILNNAEAALSFLDRDVPDLEEVRGALHDIAEQDRHAFEVVSSFARLLKQGENRSELVDLNDLTGEVLELARGELARKEVRVHTDLVEPIPRVRGDRVLLSLILLNLVRNSAEAMAEVPPSERILTVTTGSRDGLVELTVSDRGPGIPDSDREQVFEPFITTKEDGSGLGLAVSRTLVDMHGGRIWSESGPGGLGTSMHVSLPVGGSPPA